MRLSFAQAEALNIDRTIIEAAMADPAPPTRAPDDGMSKLQRALLETIASHRGPSGLVRHVVAEALNFRLAGRTWFRPDFLVWPAPASDWRPTLVEAKGWLREDAAVKIKVAADMYPMFRWLLVYRDGRHSWEVREVDRSGIGRDPIVVGWINGV